MKKIVVLGTSFGDEGKSKITNYLANDDDIIVRYQDIIDKTNKIVLNNDEYYLEYLPVSTCFKKVEIVFTSNMFLDPKKLYDEISFLELHGINPKIKISEKAKILMPYHIICDSEYCEENRNCVDMKGLMSARVDVVKNNVIEFFVFVSDSFSESIKRIIDYKNKTRQLLQKPLFNLQMIYSEYIKYANKLSKYMTNTSVYVQNAMKEKKRVIFESTLSQFEGIENGVFPFKRPTYANISFASLSVGINNKLLKTPIGITKAYLSISDDFFMPTEVKNENIIKHFYNKGYEYDNITKTYHKVGWFDSVIVKEAIRVNGIKYIALTLLDALTGLDKIKVAISYNHDGKKIDHIPNCLTEYKKVVPDYVEFQGWNTSLSGIKRYRDLPKNLKLYLKELEKILNVKIVIISFGKDDNDILTIKNILK